jgi:hypothetical protein
MARVDVRGDRTRDIRVRERGDDARRLARTNRAIEPRAMAGRRPRANATTSVRASADAMPPAPRQRSAKPAGAACEPVNAVVPDVSCCGVPLVSEPGLNGSFARFRRS